jgi:hypothetical protein
MEKTKKKKENRRVKMLSFRVSDLEYEKIQLLSKINRSAIIRQLLLSSPSDLEQPYELNHLKNIDELDY